MVYLYHGEDNYLSLIAVKDLIKEISNRNKENDTTKTDSINSAIINAEAISPTSIIEKLTTQSMFGGTETFIIKRIYSNKEKDKLIPEIIEILKKEKETTKNYIFWEDSKVKSNTKLFKYINGLKGDTEFKALNKRQFLTWISNIADHENIKISKTALDLLSSRVNFNPERGLKELEKLNLLGKEEISDMDIIDNIAQTLEQKIWDLTDAVNQHNRKHLIEIYRNLVSNQIDPSFIIAMITRNYRLIYLAKHLNDEGKTSREIPAILKVPPFTIFPIINQAKNTEYSTLKNIYEKLSNLDYLSKIGELDLSINLPLLLLKIN